MGTDFLKSGLNLLSHPVNKLTLDRLYLKSAP